MPTTPATAPASTVTSLIVGDGNVVSEADQLAFTVTISGTLSAALPAGDTVQVLLPSGVPRQATVAADGTEFSLVLTGTAAIAFSIPGQVSAAVTDPDGNQSTPFSQTFAAAAARAVLPVTSTPADFAASGASELALSGDGKSVAFVASESDGVNVTSGLYVQRVDTGALTLVSASGRAPSLSADGTLVTYLVTQNGLNQVVLQNLTTGVVTQLSDPQGGSTGYEDSTRPSIADDGTVVFESAGDAALNGDPNQQIFLARVSDGVATRTLVSVAADGTPGNGYSQYATISADGSTVVFVSNATNLLSPGDPHAAGLVGTFQIYARALRDNPATGQRAGTTVLVSANPDGTPSDGSDHNPVVSGDGRYVLFQSVDNNSQVYLTDLLTGTTRIVSTNASGALANAGAFGATLSADGNTVVFESAATNLLAPEDAANDLTQSQQVYAKNLATGQVTLLSEGGFNPADDTSQDPTVSADGTVAGFASSADNLAPGVLGGDNPYPTSRGYVTAVTGTPSLAITAPAAALATTTAVLTGTIDQAHATTPIILTDAADPGFLPVVATVTAGADPYVDTWTATVIFTQAGSQTVTATAGGVTAQATVTLLNAPSLTIDPVNGTDTITATGQPGHATIVTGGNPATIGGTVALFLRTADGHLLTLGSATTGADGRWSISVPDSALGSQSSASDALVAEAVDASGNKTRAALAIALTIPAQTVLYTYRFTYTDGSFYTGTVADDGTYGYTPGQTITTSAGRYVIGAAGTTTTQSAGSVTAASYYDVSTSNTSTPTAAAGGTTDGTGGLGSEADSITGPAGPQSFGGGVTEARESANTAYDFVYVYNDGSSYSGTVVGGAGSGYTAGQTLKDSNGFYQITSSAGATTAAIGTVSTSLYYDAISAATYVPVLYGQGKASGLQGLGSEEDTLSTPSGGTTFGLGGVAKAALKLVLTYSFEFLYPDGSAYFGYAADDGTYKYSNGEVIKTPHGKYFITSVSTTSVSVGGNVLTPGDVTVSLYYDSSSKQNYTPIDYAQGILTATEGLGTEGDLITGASGSLLFGYGGIDEAKQYPDRLFAFTFTYKDGSFYYGNVVDDGSYNYYVGETITTAYGHYHIGYSSPLISGEGGLVSGEVYTQNYYDITSGGPYETFHQSVDTPSGVNGLGSENDSVLDSAGVAHVFGGGGKDEAKLTPYTLLDFTFYYKDGSFYTGQLSSDGVNGPQAGQSISSPAGYFDVYARDGATGAPPGTVSLYNYYDVTDGKYYTPHSYSNDNVFGTYGLFSAAGYLDSRLFLFGDAGAYEVKHAPNTSWEFQFIYPDGAFYIGRVVENSQLGLYPGFIEKTPYGYYSITGATSNTSLPLGSVTLSYYYDVTTQKVYTPVDEGAQGIDGTSGLGSEYADTRDDGNDEEFGYGGQYEAKQSEVRHFTFTFRYNDGSFYYGDFASYVHLYLPGTIIQVTGGYYVITAFDDEHSSLPSGTVHVSSYFDIGTGRFYTPVRYAEGKASGTDDIGSELDYISAGGGGLRSFGGPTHIEANTTNTGFSARLTTATEFAFDGPIQGATVGYLDPNALPGTLSIDPAQPTATTNADGSYQLGVGTGPLVLIGGTDTATGLPFKGVLESAGNGPVLSPVTTLLEATANALGDTSLAGIAAAETLLSTAFGLPAGLDLTTYLPGDILRDPATSPNDIPAAEAVYRAGAKLMDAEALIDAAGGHSLAAIDTVAAALADGSLTDLTDIAPLIEDGGLAPPAETAIKIIVAATNAALDQQLADVNTPAAILGFITGASIALQGGAASALAAPNADDAAFAISYVQTLPFTLEADDILAMEGTIPCFRRGTRILTERGEIAVEDLREGDRVATRFSGLAPVTWLGHRRVDCARHAHPERVWPVRVRAHAFGDDRPRRDVWLSPDHAVFIEGRLIQIRQLVNGATILQEPMERVTYYHVELARHDVLTAEGLAAESYLDTGNRTAFANGAAAMALHPDFAGPDQDRHGACAPFATCAEAVAPVWHRLALRANKRGFAARATESTCDPQLRVMARGAGLRPIDGPGGSRVFAVPPETRLARLVSRAALPSATRPWLDDRRRLGVCVGRIRVWSDDQAQEIAIDHPGLTDGWHGAECEGDRRWRWTDGDACLPLPPGATMLQLRLAGTAEYPLQTAPTDTTAFA